jgi:hypothetical protein
MRTKEEILKSILDYKIAIVNNPDYTFNKVLEAMGMASDEQSVAFAEWIRDNALYRNDFLNGHRTIAELLEIFKKEKPDKLHRLIEWMEAEKEKNDAEFYSHDVDACLLSCIEKAKEIQAQ